MARESLTGSRIRERRMMKGVRQADLARKVDISASYLNLIEHNRRRIGGKLLVDIAAVLGVEPSMLTEGAEAALVSTLREAAVDTPIAPAEAERADEFAGRFPGWAEVLAAEHRRVASLERTVQTLSDRLTHDPHLAASLHEVLSTAAAIRSTASILAETGELEAEWRDRFHRNLNEDSARLAESSRALVNFLDESETGHERRGVPQEEVEAFFVANDHHFADLETGQSTPERLVSAAPELVSNAARRIAQSALREYQATADRLPLDRVQAALQRHGVHPGAIARELGCDLQLILRRLATLPEGMLPTDVGLVMCDASGSLLFRRTLPGFDLPRFGACCPLWPLFSALHNPQVPIRRVVEQQGRGDARFECFAVAWPKQMPDFESDPVYLSVMLILPVAETADEEARLVGSSCRVCPGRDCMARREPSILNEEF